MKGGMFVGWKSLFFFAVFLVIPNLAFAGLLMPIDVNDLYEYNKHDSANPQHEWAVRLQGLQRVDVGGQQYMKIGFWNEHGTGDYQETLARSTENAVYTTDGSIAFQIAPVGTTWNYPSYQEHLGPGTNFNEIVSVESVTVPYGIFNNAYVDKVYFDPDDPSFNNTPYWYEYIVPDVGWVKQVDYLFPNGPATLELARIHTVPEPASLSLLGLGLLGLVFKKKKIV